MDTAAHIVNASAIDSGASATAVNLEETPLKALRYKSRQGLSKLLNASKILLSDDGFPRDWRGIAHLAGLHDQYGLALDQDCDPMARILTVWSEQHSGTATIGQLQKFLEMIDRHDVKEELSKTMVEDAVSFRNVVEQINQATDLMPVSAEGDVITRHDVTRLQQGLEPQKYDAFVLFAEEDIDFASELIERMEDFGLKLCVKDRDLVGGITFEHEAIMRLISERCNRLVIVVSPNFFRSPANSFFINFAAALGIEQRRRKIVPCVYRTCDLPPTLRFYFLLYYERSGRLWNFWDKLRDSLQANVMKVPEVCNSSASAVALPNKHDIPKKQKNCLRVEENTLDEQSKVKAVYSGCNEEAKYSEDSVKVRTTDNFDSSKKNVDANGTNALKSKWYEKILFPNTLKSKPKKEKPKKTKRFRKKLALGDS